MDLPSEYLTTRELAELLRIKERKIYDLASSGQVPCTRATGKLLFSRKAIDAWLAANAVGDSSTAKHSSLPNVFLGSHDPLLDWAISASECGIASYFDGSLAGLQRFSQGEGIASSMHIYAPEDDDWNRPAVKSAGVLSDAVLVSFCRRSRGIIYRPGLGQIETLDDLKLHRFVGRQAKAGAQLLLDHMFGQQGINPADINFAETAHTEADAATTIVENRADAALGLECYATQHRLGFIPLIEEQFDLLVNRRAWFETSFQTLLRFCATDKFSDRAATLPGYDISQFGAVRLNK
jgi:putative molybdopterin biosynthesis protein